MHPYTFRIDHIEYVAHKDGSPLTLVDCIRATQHDPTLLAA